MTEIAFTISFGCPSCHLLRRHDGSSSFVESEPSETTCSCGFKALLPSLTLSHLSPPPRFQLRTSDNRIIGGEEGEGEPLLDMSQAVRMAYRIAIILKMDVIVTDMTANCVVDHISPYGRLERTVREAPPQPRDLN